MRKYLLPLSIVIIIIIGVGIFSMSYIFINASKKTETMDSPKPNEIWAFESSDPFKKTTFKILNVKEDYVQYMCLEDSIIESSSIKRFVFYTKKIK